MGGRWAAFSSSRNRQVAPESRRHSGQGTTRLHEQVGLGAVRHVAENSGRHNDAGCQALNFIAGPIRANTADERSFFGRLIVIFRYF